MSPFLVGLLVSVVATGVAIPLLRRAAVMDEPNARSSHVHVVPRGGGLGVALGILVAVLSAGVDVDSGVVLVAALLAAGLGLLDDVAGLSASTRLGVQILLAAGVVLWLLRGEWQGPVLAGAGLVAGLIWLVGYVNTFNFMDGINGVSAFSAAVAGGWYAWLGHSLDARGLTVMGLALAGAAIGFAPWNALRAKVFLGDAGSYGIGMLIAGLVLLAILAGGSVAETVAPLVLYLGDTGWALAKRVRRGDSWREAHREHVYQRLVDGGWPHTLVAALLASLAIVACVVTVVAPLSGAIVGLIVIVLAYLAVPAIVLRTESVTA